MQKILIFIIAVIIIISLFCLYQRITTGKAVENKENSEKTRHTEVCFKKHCFQVEIADTFLKRTEGLMNREELDEDKGMLFVFSNEAEHSFWMKNTFIPLDIIWIDKHKEIVFIKNNAEPCNKTICESITPDKKALYVLEINAGMAEKTGMEVGDKIELNGGMLF